MAGRSKVVVAVGVSPEDAMASANALKTTALLKPTRHIEKICVRETARMYESLALGKMNTKTSLRSTRKTGVDATCVIETNAKFSVSDLRMRFEGVQGPLAVRESLSKCTTSERALSRSRYDVYGVSLYEENDTEDEVNVNEQDDAEVVEEDVVAEEEICPTPPQLVEKSSTTSLEKAPVPSEESTSSDKAVVALNPAKTAGVVPTADAVPVPVPARAILPPMTTMMLMLVFLHFMIRVIVKVGLTTALWMVSTMWWLVVSMGWWMIGSLVPEVVAGGLVIGVVIRVIMGVIFGALTALNALVRVFKIVFTVSMTMMTYLVAGLKWCTRTGILLMTTMSTWLSVGWSLTSFGLVRVWHAMLEGGRRTKLWVVGTWASMKAMVFTLWLWLEVAYVAMWFCWFVMAQIVRFDCTKVEKTKVSMMVQEVEVGSSTSAVLVEQKKKKKKKKSDDFKEDKSSDVETDSDMQTDSETVSMSESEASSKPLSETETETKPMEPTMDKVKMDLDRLTQPWTHATTMDMTAETNEVYKVLDEVVVEWCTLPPSDQHAALGRGSIDTVGCDRTVSVGDAFVVVDGVEVTCVGESTVGSIGSRSGCGCGCLELVDLHELANEVHGPARVDMDASSSSFLSVVSSSSSSSSVSFLAPSSSQELSVFTTVEAAVEFELTIEVEIVSRSALEREFGLTEIEASHEDAPRVPVVTSATTEPASEPAREHVTRATSVATSVSSQSTRGRTTKRKPKMEVTSLYLLYKTHSKSYQRNVDGSLAKRKALEVAKDRGPRPGGCRRRHESAS